MAKKISITNNTVRLVSLFGISLAPGQSLDVDDTADNRATVKGVDGLDVGKAGQAVEKTEPENLAPADAAQSSATGAGWGQ